MPRARSRRCPRAARLQHRGHAAPSRRNRNESHPRRTRRSHSRSSWMARRQRPQGSQKHLAPAAAAACAGAQPPRKYLAIHAGKLAVEPHLQILRRNRRSLLLRLEYAHRSTLENHVHRSPRLGSRRSLIMRVGMRSPRGETVSADFGVTHLHARPKSLQRARAVLFGQVRELLDFLTWISSFEGF